MDADEVKEEPSEIKMKRVMSAEASVLQNRISPDETKNIFELWEINVTSAQYKRFF